MKLGPGGGSRVQGTSRTAFIGDQNDAWRPKGFRHDKARPIGAREPLQKLEAQKNDRKDRSRIEDPKQSAEELFHPRKPIRT